MEIFKQLKQPCATCNNTVSSEIFQECENIAQQTQASAEEIQQQQNFLTANIPGVSQILPSLYLCGASVVTPKVIEQLRVNLVINVAPELPDTPINHMSSCRTLYLRIKMLDRPDEDIYQHFDEVADMIEEVRLSGGKSLVHCVAGVSRSASLCLAYIMKYAQMNLHDAVMHVKMIRPQIRPNSGFVQQLRSYEQELFGTQSVKMVFIECLQKEVPDIYASEYRLMEEFYQRNRKFKLKRQDKETLRS